MKPKERIAYAMPEHVLKLLKGKSYQYLTTLPQHDQFALNHLLTSYLSKFCTPEGLSAEAREAATFQKWQQSELLCYHTNVRLAHHDMFSLTGRLLAEMRRLIKSVLGAMPSMYHEHGAFSGGATVDTRRGTHYTEKVWGAISCGENNIIDACFAVGNLSPTASLVPYGYCRAAQVPKNNTINRMIAIEPTASMFLQKAIGSLIRRRLKRVGVDLDDQTINQRGASMAHTRGLATIDLSSASDSVSLELVRAVIPHDWLRELDKHRSPRMMYKGREFTLQKYSSMGNGYTFELESLIFWALCKAVCQQDYINVYGDDIIVAKTDAQQVIAALTMIGFQVNKDKSFISGSFYESCGSHFFDGHDVTPCYQKEAISDLAAAMRMHNRLVRWALRGPSWRFDIIQDALAYIIGVFGHRDHAIPYGVQRDDGWLVELSSPLLSVNEHGDFRCRVLSMTQKVNHLKSHLHDSALAYKLFRPHHLNEDPKGYPGKPGRQAYRRRQVIVWRSSIAPATP